MSESIFTETRGVTAIAVHPGNYVDVLTLWDAAGEPVVLDDLAGGCKLVVGEVRVDRWVLLEWLPTVKEVEVDLGRDRQRYDYVVEARFRGVAK